MRYVLVRAVRVEPVAAATSLAWRGSMRTFKGCPMNHLLVAGESD